MLRSYFVLTLIISTEFCERFCFYALRSLAYPYLHKSLLLSTFTSKLIVHLFFIIAFMSSIVGGFMADFVLGQYRTILYSSFIYSCGTILIFTSSLQKVTALFVMGLLLTAIGTGGIKSTISTFGASQLNSDSEVALFFPLFYFFINAGALLSMIISPLLSTFSCGGNTTCYPLAFFAPLMALMLAQMAFFVGSTMFKKDLVKLNSFIELKHRLATYKIENSIDIQRVRKVCSLFIPISVFWMLFDQQSTAWTEQGDKMNRSINLIITSFIIESSQMQTFNALFMLILIPIFTQKLYKSVLKDFKPIDKMCLGMFFAAIGFLFSTIVENTLSVYKIHILAQIPQYIFISIGEVLLSITGLEYAFNNSPESMRSVVLAFWYISVAAGNVLTIIVSILFKRGQEHTLYAAYTTIGFFATFVLLVMKKPLNKL